MALAKHNPYPEVTDYFGQYQNWKQVVLPSGEIVYEVPGHPERVFVPSLSNASGRVVLRDNPKQTIADDAAAKQRAQDQQDAQDRAIKQQQANQSPLGQLLPIGAGTTGIILAQQFMPKTADPIQQAIANQITQRGVQQGANIGAQQTVNAQSQAAAQGFTGAPSTPNVLGANPIAQVGTNADGSSIMSDGSNIPAADQGFNWTGTSTLGDVIGAAGAAKGAYDTFNATQNGGKGFRTGLSEMGGGLGTIFGGPAGGAIGTVGGSVVGYGLQNNNIKGDLALAAATGGLSIPYIALRHLGFNPMKSIIHETTRQVAQKHTNDLLNQAPDDQVYQGYVAGMRGQTGPADPSKPFAGKYASWDEYKTAGLDASDLTGVYGNIKTYGPAWAGLTQPQRQAVTQANIDSGIYTSKKGEVEITDPVKAKENFNNVMKGFQVGVQTSVAPVPMVPTTPAHAAAQGFNQAAANDTRVIAPILTPQTDLQRTVSRSPGIGLNGQRIVY